MRTRQHGRRHHAQRLLLLTGLGIGLGFGVSLALTDDASAADGEPATDTIAVLRSANPLGQTHTPRLAGDLADDTSHAIDGAAATTSHATKRTTARADHVTPPLPVLDHAVDRATDLTEPALDVAAQLPRLAAIDAPLRIPLKRPAGGGPQTAPELTATSSPTPVSVSSGAPAHLLPWQHPTTAPDRTTGAVTPARTSSPASIAAAPATPTPWPGRCGQHPDETATVHTQTAGDHTTRWSAVVDLWQQATTRYIHHLSSRTPPPTPPSG
ncbi:hypothetical protein ACVCAH_11650 [Micromonospora sp. LZ34]